MKFTARVDNDQRFYANTCQRSRGGASVNQVWFDRGEVSYLMTECIGGNCPHRAGLAVLQGEKVLMNGRCTRAGPDGATFSRTLVDFGSDAADSHSNTPLLRIEDADNDIVIAYSGRR